MSNRTPFKINFWLSSASVATSGVWFTIYSALQSINTIWTSIRTRNGLNLPAGISLLPSSMGCFVTAREGFSSAESVTGSPTVVFQALRDPAYFVEHLDNDGEAITRSLRVQDIFIFSPSLFTLSRWHFGRLNLKDSPPEATAAWPYWCNWSESRLRQIFQNVFALSLNLADSIGRIGRIV